MFYINDVFSPKIHYIYISNWKTPVFIKEEKRMDIEQTQTLAESGEAEAQYLLGQYFEFGRGVLQSHTKAAYWYGLAAGQGLAHAQYALGLLYQNGRGVELDIQKAVELYQKAADQGDPWAQNNLGYLYSQGKGVPEDQIKASNYYRKAAQKGHFQGQFNIAARYASGQGCDVDLVEAHYWFSKAHIGATALQQERIKKALERIEEVMSNEDIAKAQKRLQSHTINE